MALMSIASRLGEFWQAKGNERRMLLY
jgi:hypothetical protein